MNLDIQLEDLLVEWQLRQDADGTVDLDELCKDCPERRDSLTEAIASLESTGWMLEGPPRREGSLPQQPNATTAVAGRILGDYRVLAQIGSGGMGVVYRALHTRLNKEVALKVLSEGRSRSAAAIARFEQEMRAIGQLDHPNIVSAHHAGEDDGVYFLAMDLVEGVDASQVKTRQKPISTADACEVVRQAALGLAYAHEHGLVHRDIKPSNLMVADNGVVRLLDLGLARLDASDATQSKGTTTGHVMGTIDFMAPEQLDDSGTVDRRADIYALGATLFWLLTGRSPLGVPENSGRLSRVRAISLGQISRLGSARPDLPPDLLALVDQMLSPAAAQRPDSANTVATALEPFCAGHDLTNVTGAEQSLLATAQVDREDTVVSVKVRRPKSASRATSVITGLLLSAAVSALLAVIYVQTSNGTLVVEMGEGVTIEALREEGVRLVHKASDQVYDLRVGEHSQRAGEYVIRVKQASSNLEFSTTELKIGRGARQVLRVTLKPAVARPGEVPLRRTQTVGESPAQPTSPLAGLARVVVDPPGAATLEFDQPVLDDRIHQLRFTPDGSKLLVSGVGETVVAVAPKTGKELQQMAGYKKRSRGMAVSADGATLYCGDADGRILEHDIATGKRKRTVADFGGTILDLDLSPEGDRLAAAVQGFGIRVLSLVGGEELTFQGNYDICPFWKDRGTLFSFGLDNSAARFDLNTLEVTTLREDTTARDGTFCVFAERNVAAFVRQDGTVDIFNVLTGNLLRQLQVAGGGSLVTRIASTKELLAIGMRGNSIQIVNMENRTVASYLTVPGLDACSSLEFAPDGNSLVVGTSKGRLLSFKLAHNITDRRGVVVKPPGFASLRHILAGHRATVLQVAFSQDLSRLYSTSDDGTVRVWNLATGEQTSTLVEDRVGFVRPLLLREDGKTLVVGGRRQNSVRFINTATGEIERRLSGHDNLVDDLDISSDGRWLVTSARSEPVLLHDLQDGGSQPLSVSGANDCRFVLRDRYLLVVKWGAPPWLIDVATRQVVRRVAKHVRAWHHIGLNQERTVASFGSRTAFGYVWDLQTDRKIMSFKAETGDTVTNTILTPDGKTVISRLDNGHTRFLDVATGHKLGELDGLENKDYTLNHYLSPDGSRLAVCGRDAMIRVYEIHWPSVEVN